MYSNIIYLQEDCKDCPAGYYCDGTLQNDTFCSHGVQNPELCLPGYYCPINTKFWSEFPCPIGKLGLENGLEAEADCTPCTPGKYCASTGLSVPTDDCQAGYYCTQGASLPAPTDGVTGDICANGSYCPQGANASIPCPAGTYGPTEGNNF